MDESIDFTDRTLIDSILGDSAELDPVDDVFCRQYLDNVASFGVSKLVQEPTRLTETKENLLLQTQSLAFDNYQTFIQAAECSKEIYRDFNTVEERVEALTQSIPQLISQINQFSSSSHSISSSRKQNSLVLSRHSQLLEILEISQLMDSCVRNGYYDEALELSSYVKRLHKKFSNISIIADIGIEVKRSTQLMLNQLLQQLRGAIQLPACLRIISYLRQLDAFNEAELRIKFLQARNAWLLSVLAQVPEDDAYNHITRTIEVSRVNLFDIVTQYRAIFTDDDPLYAGDDEKFVDLANILRSWLTRKVSDFLMTLEKDLSKGLVTRLESVYGQCMYFGLSFSRIGADFRGVIVSLFHRTLLKHVGAAIKTATCRFEEELKTFAIPTRAMKDRPTPAKDKAVTSPPLRFLLFPPLAIYTNGILSCFNDIRQYPAVS